MRWPSAGCGVSIHLSFGVSVESKGMSMLGRCVMGMTGCVGVGGCPEVSEKGFIVGCVDLNLGSSGDQKRYALLRGR